MLRIALTLLYAVTKIDEINLQLPKRFPNRHSTRGVLRVIGHEFEQRAVRVAEIDAGAGPARAEAPDGPELDRNP